MTTIRSISVLEAIRQRKLIIYNIPGQAAIDLMDGRQCYFRGDEILMKDDFLRNFHIRPCRTRHRIASIHELGVKEFRIKSKQVLIIDSVINLRSNQAKLSIDLVIISKSPKIKMTALYRAFTIKQIVIDGSAPSWKARQWKKECDSLRIPCYIVSEKGSFVMNW
jgi:competence protein ComEC